MTDAERWVVQAKADQGGIAGMFYARGCWWLSDLQDADRFDSEISALRLAADVGPSRVCAVRRVPAKRRWEQRADPAGGNLRLPYVHCNGAHYEVVELPPEPSDRWELVPE